MVTYYTRAAMGAQQSDPGTIIGTLLGSFLGNLGCDKVNQAKHSDSFPVTIINPLKSRTYYAGTSKQSRADGVFTFIRNGRGPVIPRLP